MSEGDAMYTEYLTTRKFKPEATTTVFSAISEIEKLFVCLFFFQINNHL